MHVIGSWWALESVCTFCIREKQLVSYRHSNLGPSSRLPSCYTDYAIPDLHIKVNICVVQITCCFASFKTIFGFRAPCKPQMQPQDQLAFLALLFNCRAIPLLWCGTETGHQARPGQARPSSRTCSPPRRLQGSTTCIGFHRDGDSDGGSAAARDKVGGNILTC